MIETWLIPLGAGVVLGLLYFGCLWKCTHLGLRSACPAGWFLLSFVVRLVLAMTAFWLIAQQSAARLLICLVGFTISRVVMVSLIAPGVARQTASIKEHPTCA